MPPSPQPQGPGPEPSPKNYGVAVALSAVLGWMGAQHFYLGRPGLAFLDFALTLGWIVSFALGHWQMGSLLLVIDVGHALLVTIQLLVGSFRDGQGRIVCYPGQKLGSPFLNHEMRSST